MSGRRFELQGLSSVVPQGLGDPASARQARRARAVFARRREKEAEREARAGREIDTFLAGGEIPAGGLAE